ncbi:hypothetical protein ACSVDA_09345 [Cytobacillus sp. Hm23]|nr:hypothetical protein [Cytobacillus sp. IB215665]MDX8365774.1 hypothetical protein [Cytobacillus sp. IB215665]
MNNDTFAIAQLASDDLTKVQRIEEELRTDTGEEIILIAYKNTERQ